MRVAVLQIGYGDDETDRRPGRRGSPPWCASSAGTTSSCCPSCGRRAASPTESGIPRGQPVDGPIGTAMSAAARDAGVVLHAGSIVERPRRTGVRARRARTSGTPRSSTPPDGSLVATYRKIHRFGFGAGEPRLMDAGEEVVLVDLPRRAGRRPCRRACPPATTCASPSSTAASSTPAPRPFVVPAAWPAARVGTGPCSPTPAPSRTSASSSPATRPGTHAGTEMGGHSQVVSADRRGARDGRERRAGAQC